MDKKATIIISLVKESEEQSNEDLEKEIYTALSELPMKIPWMKKWKKSRLPTEIEASARKYSCYMPLDITVLHVISQPFPLHKDN